MSTTFLKVRVQRQRGIGIIAAIFILVILSSLAGFVVAVTATQNVTIAQDVQGVRAYHAARAGLEYGLQRWLVGNACGNASLSIDGFTVTLEALKSPDTPATGDLEFCSLTATATAGGAVGSLGYVERQLNIVLETPGCRAWGTIGDLYTLGDVVTHSGQTWTALQSHTYAGDPNWAPGIAAALWALAGSCG